MTGLRDGHWSTRKILGVGRAEEESKLKGLTSEQQDLLCGDRHLLSKNTLAPSLQSLGNQNMQPVPAGAQRQLKMICLQGTQPGNSVSSPLFFDQKLMTRDNDTVSPASVSGKTTAKNSAHSSCSTGDASDVNSESSPPPPPVPAYPEYDRRGSKPRSRPRKGDISALSRIMPLTPGTVDPSNSRKFVSVGSYGHPHACAGACRYVKRKSGCRHGFECHKCHICFWSRHTSEKPDGDASGSSSSDCVPSLGTQGHPHHCGLPCKYVRKKGGCRDGANCLHCHACLWQRDRLRHQSHAFHAMMSESFADEDDEDYAEDDDRFEFGRSTEMLQRLIQTWLVKQ